MEVILPFVMQIQHAYHAMSMEVESINIPISFFYQLDLEFQRLIAETKPNLKDRTFARANPYEIGEYRGIKLTQDGSDELKVTARSGYRL